MFYRHTGVIHTGVPKERGWCNTKSFRPTYYSSNNLDFFSTRNGYVICENVSGYNLMEAKVSLSTNQNTKTKSSSWLLVKN